MEAFTIRAALATDVVRFGRARDLRDELVWPIPRSDWETRDPHSRFMVDSMPLEENPSIERRLLVVNRLIWKP